MNAPPSQPSRRLLAVLACHGRAAITCRALEALFAQNVPSKLSIGAVLVDDGSPDDTIARVSKAFPEVEIVRGDGSLWWAGAMTLGLERAALREPDWLLWLNDDVVLDPDAIARLVTCHDDHDIREGGVPIVIGATRDPVTGRLTYGGQRRAGARPFRFESLAPSEFPQRCDTFQGNIVLVPLSVHRRLGGIHPSLMGVQGSADTDFGLRAAGAAIPLIQASGLIGECAPNMRPAPWADPGLSRRERLAGLVGPRGFPPRAWLPFARRHGGWAWPVWALSPYVLRLWPAVRQARAVALEGRRPKVAMMDGVIPAYRLSMLAGLAALPAWHVVAFHGRTPRNFRAVAADRPLPIASHAVRHLTWPGGRRMAWTGGVWSALAGRYAIAVLEFSVHNLGIWTLWLARQIIGRPRIILHGHFDLSRDDRLKHRLRHALRLLLARGADALMPYTEAGRAACLRHGLPADRIFVTHNTIDVAAARAAAGRVSAAATQALRDQHGLSASDRIFLFVGRLYSDKRVELAVQAVEQLRRSGHPVALLIVGDGPDRSRISASIGDPRAVHLLPAETDEDRLAPFFAVADAVLCPGAVGLVITHAFAYGRPLVACAGGDHGVEIDYLRPGQNGLLVPRRADALAAALARLMDEDGLLRRLSEGAVASADGMSIDSLVAANDAAYRRVWPLAGEGAACGG
jgi:GT2 family glycosyltransferase/glycosyltransferase involved in cell wall biosynthesis